MPNTANTETAVTYLARRLHGLALCYRNEELDANGVLLLTRDEFLSASLPVWDRVWDINANSPGFYDAISAELHRLEALDRG